MPPKRQKSPYKLALFGNPVAHSLSPQLHQQFAQEAGFFIDYQKIQVQPGEFKAAVDTFRAAGGVGANITLPFKTIAHDYADQLTERAQHSGSVNTFIFRNNICIGDNTDGVGLIRAFHHHLHWPLKNKRILLLGAGGAARAILPALIAEQPETIFIWNRTKSNAEALITKFQLSSSSRYDEIDILINATNADFNTLSLSLHLKNTRCYDLNYGKRHQSFLQWAITHHAMTISDGYSMLVEQGKESFSQWFSD